MEPPQLKWPNIDILLPKLHRGCGRVPEGGRSLQCEKIPINVLFMNFFVYHYKSIETKPAGTATSSGHAEAVTRRYCAVFT